jgi:hypothetical protein
MKHVKPPRKSLVAIAIATSLMTSFAFGTGVAHAGAREQAKRLHDRLAGVPPTAPVLTQMETLIAGGPAGALQAAQLAMQSPAFYSVVLKNFATPWTNRDQTVFAPLNDYSATVVGMIRDDVRFDTVLSADILYVGGSGLPAYSPANNDLYEQLENTGANLGDTNVLVRTTQSQASGLPPAATAGVMTSRAAAQAFFVAGTNRAMFRFTMINHMCKDLEQLADTTRPPDRIRQDVSRSPGGDSRIFLNNCVGCHSGMDPLAQAFAFYNWNETTTRIEYTPALVQPKYHINADNFRPGYVTPDDRWENRWRKGQNQVLGWSGALPGSGAGAKSLGEEIGASDQFARCQVEKVFKTVCLRAPGNPADHAKVDSIAALFKSGGYKMKDAFAQAAVYCMGS